MCVLKEAEAGYVNSYDPAAVLFNLYFGIIPCVRVCVRVCSGGSLREKEKKRAECAHAGQNCFQAQVKRNIQNTDVSGDTLNICSVSVSLRRCVEIIAKEGRSLKELYLVSCKITDHGRILSNHYPYVAVNLQHYYHNHYYPQSPPWFRTHLIFTTQPFWDLQTVKILLKSFTQNKVMFTGSPRCSS